MTHSWTPDICIHHSPCDDGFAAAWVVKRRWRDVLIVGTNYGLPFPGVDYTGKNVLIADFSYKPAQIGELMTERGARSVVILDHHKTAQADLEGFKVEMCGDAKFCASDIGGMFRDMAELDRPAVLARFDMGRSGASLAWEFCFPDQPVPMMIRYIEDRDLWRFKLPATRAFSMLLRSYPYDFDKWSELANYMTAIPDTIIEEARAIERFYDRNVADIVATATFKEIGHWKDIPTVHAPYAFASDAAHQLLKANPDAPFAAVIVDAHGGRTYSLRSEDSRQDVSEVARQFGGGGHRNAAGFRVPAP